MARIAFVFAGQGAQTPGMGKSLAEASPAAAEVFRRAEALRPGTMRQCFEGTEEELARTENTQPCLWTVEMAAAAALAEAGIGELPAGISAAGVSASGQSGIIPVEAAAGFSLGEIAALTYSGAVDFETGFRLVCRRGEFMSKAAGEADAAMAAVLKLERETVESLCEGFPHVWPVNYNCPGQISVAGLSGELESFAQAVKEAGGRARLLKVSGGFHSPLMKEASEAFAGLLEQTPLGEARLPLYSNKTGLPYGEEKRQLLAEQICSPVRWQEIVEHMAAQGIDTFVELGPGRTLCGLISRIVPDAVTLQVSDAESLAATLEGCRKC